MIVLSGLLESPLSVLGEIAIARIHEEEITDQRNGATVAYGAPETP